MDQPTAKRQQILIQQTGIIKGYPRLWSQVIDEWQQPGFEEQAWLIYSANYLFRTNNIRWALDPIRLRQRLLQAPEVDILHDLRGLSFVLLTHEHADHLDLQLIRSLKNLPITWIVPSFILKKVVRETGLSTDHIVIPEPLKPFKISGIRITPFHGLHMEKQPNRKGVPPRGVPAMAYLVEFNEKRWLFPGDTRTYDATQLPTFGPVDGLFAHVWLGHGCARKNELPLLDDFCRFCLDLQPRKIILTHLREFGRNAEDFWDANHTERTCDILRGRAPHVSVSPIFMGKSVTL